MKLSKEILLSEYPDYPTAVALSFEGKGLTHLKDLSLCPAVEYLSLRFNAIASTREVTACRHLWILDLQQNHLREMDGVGQFAALGTLVITGNELQLSALRPLEGLVLIHLEATFTKGTRKEVGLWIYNGKFISLNERAAYGVSLDIGKRGPIVSHKAKEVLAFLSQETNTVARELKKFTYLIRDLESACELEWQMKTGKNGTKSRGAKFPKFQLKRWECLHYSSKLILCGFLDLYLEGFFPLNFLKLLVETLVTEAFPDSPPILEAMELCELPPHYLLSLIIDLQNSIENETFPPETEAQVQSLWQALNIPFLVAHFDKVQEVLGTTDKSESFINKSAVSGSSNSVVYLSEEENIRVEQNRENLCLFAVTVLVKYGLTPQTEDRSKGNSTSALDGSVFNYVLQYAGVSKSMLKRLEVDKRKEESKLESFSKPSKDFETSNRKELDRFHSFDPQKPDEISIDPFVSDLYPASRYMSGGKEGETSMIATPQMDRTKVRDSMSENMSSIRKELTPSQSPGFSFFAKYKQFDTAPGMQPTPHFQRTQPTPTRPSRPFSEPRDLVESQSGGIIKKKRRNIGIFSAENTWKPHFVLTSEPKVTPGVQWKRIEDPPELFVVLQPSTPYATQTLGVAPMGKTRTGQRSVMQESRLSKSGLIEDRRQNESQRGGVYGEHREESEEEEEQGEEQGEQQREGQGEIREADSSLSVKIIPGSNADEPISVKLFAFDSPLFPPRMDDQTFLTSLEQQNRPKTMNVSASDSLLLRNSLTQISQSQPPKLKVNRIVPSGPWFTVPERIRCVISADPYSIAKAPNFRRDHAMQLPGPPIRPKIKAKLFVSGQGPGQEGVKKNEGVVKWVQHVLKPTLKLKQDQFCLNYAEYLHYDMNRKQMTRHPYLSDPRYHSLISSVTPYFPVATSLETQHLLFWLRNVKCYQPPIWQSLPPSLVFSLKRRAISLALSGQTNSSALIAALYDFIKLDWHVHELIPIVQKALENDSELISWDHIQQLFIAIDMVRNPMMLQIVALLQRRMISAGLNRVDLMTLMNIYRITLRMRKNLGFSIVEQIGDRCYEALAQRYSQFNIYILFKHVRDFNYLPRPAIPMTSAIHSMLIHHIQKHDLSSDFFPELINYCAKMAFLDESYPMELLTLSISSLVPSLESLKYQEFNRLSFALYQLNAAIPEDVLKVIRQITAKFKPGLWLFALMRVIPEEGRDMSLYTKAIQNSNIHEHLLILYILSQNQDEQWKRMYDSLQNYLLDIIRVDRGKTVLPALIATESKCEFSLSKALPGFTSSVLSAVFDNRLEPLRFNELRILVNCCDAHEEKVKEIVSRLARGLEPQSLYTFAKGVYYVHRIANILTIYKHMGDSVSTAALTMALKQNRIGLKSKNADLFREVINGLTENVAVSKLMLRAIDEIFDIIDADRNSCGKILKNISKFLKSTKIYNENYLKFADKMIQIDQSLIPFVDNAVSQALFSPDVLLPELVVKLSRGRCSVLDSLLLDLSIDDDKCQIRDKIISVSLRKDAALAAKFQLRLSEFVTKLPLDFISRILDLLKAETEVTQCKLILLREVDKRVKVSPPSLFTSLIALRTMHELSIIYQDCFTSAIEAILSEYQSLYIEDAIELISILGDCGYEENRRQIEKMIEKSTENDDFLTRYGEDLVTAAHNYPNFIHAPAAKQLLIKYWTNAQKSPQKVHKTAIFPLIRSETTSLDEKKQLLGTEISGETAISRLISYLLRRNLLNSTHNQSDFQGIVSDFLTLITAEPEKFTFELISEEKSDKTTKIPVYSQFLGLISRKPKGDLRFIEEIFEKRGKIVRFESESSS